MDVNLNKVEIGERMREFAVANYPRLKDFAEAVGLSLSALISGYFSGRSLPGAPLIAKLILLGCDIKWLLFGERSDKEYYNKQLEEQVLLLKEKLDNIYNITKKG
ncbi:MAG: helix-turn-helix domain-containing protein [Bacteroidetes bacterium]|nr:helix-turn-helix domain-containing protein [Bacteroidota bacterium]